MVFAVALAGLLEPLLAPRCCQPAITMKLGRPRKNLQDEAPGEGQVDGPRMSVKAQAGQRLSEAASSPTDTVRCPGLPG